MLRTIVIGSCIFIQGEFVATYADGRMAVHLDGKIYIGHPVEQSHRLAA